MPIPIRSSERNISRACCLVRDILVTPRVKAILAGGHSNSPPRTRSNTRVQILGSAAADLGVLALLPAFVLIQAVQAASHRKNDEDDHNRPIVPGKELHDAAAIVVAEITEDGEPNAAPYGQSGQELLGWILHGAGRQKHGSDGKWRRQDGGNGDGGESPALKNRVDLFYFSLREPLF